MQTTLDLIRLQVQKQVLSSQLRSVRNHDRTVRDRFFDEGQQVFVRQYLHPRKWAGGQVLRRSGPLSYDVKVKDQIYSRHASQLLQNRTGHQDLSDTQQEQLLDIHPLLRQSESQDIRNLKRNFKFRFKPQRVGNLKENQINLQVRRIRRANTRRLNHQLLSAPRHRHARRKSSYRRRREV